MTKIFRSAALRATKYSAERLGFELAPKFFDTLNESTKDIVRMVKPFTMTSDQRLAALCDAVAYIVARNIPGDIVECGVWKGGSSMAVAECLTSLNSVDRDLYLYDTFEGMSEPTELDKEINTGNLAEDLMAQTDKTHLVWAYSSLDEVKSNLSRTAYPQNRIHFIKGKVEDTIPGVLPDKISLLRLDTDWYESTNHELHHLFPILSPGGVIIIDDYGHWDGARRAVDEYFSNSGQEILLSRVDYTGRMAIKA